MLKIVMPKGLRVMPTASAGEAEFILKPGSSLRIVSPLTEMPSGRGKRYTAVAEAIDVAVATKAKASKGESMDRFAPSADELEWLIA